MSKYSFEPLDYGYPNPDDLTAEILALMEQDEVMWQARIRKAKVRRTLKKRGKP